jgi:hypothetical protein
MTLFKTWCQRIEAEGDLEVYSFPGLEVQTEGQASWLTSPSSWNAEYLVVLAGWLGTMNSASGGMPQVQHGIPKVCRHAQVISARRILIALQMRRVCEIGTRIPPFLL